LLPDVRACQDYLEKLGEGDLDWQYVAGYLRQPESAAVGETGRDTLPRYGPRGLVVSAGPVKFRLHLLGKIILNAMLSMSESCSSRKST